MNRKYEVEVKSLLGSRDRAEALLQAMRTNDPKTIQLSQNKQLNHYFQGGDLSKLSEILAPHLSEDAKRQLEEIATNAREFSVRSRDKDGTVLIVIKISVDDASSANGVARLEFEENVSLSLEELDSLILLAGFSYQAKWSREREEYQYKDTNICLDKNAGYGYVVEFEKVVGDESLIKDARGEIDSLMLELGIEELPQDRLERMFAHYNSHWPEYYGTDKTFSIE